MLGIPNIKIKEETLLYLQKLILILLNIHILSPRLILNQIPIRIIIIHTTRLIIRAHIIQSTQIRLRGRIIRILIH
jgi:hypothetical protein